MHTTNELGSEAYKNSPFILHKIPEAVFQPAWPAIGSTRGSFAISLPPLCALHYD